MHDELKAELNAANRLLENSDFWFKGISRSKSDAVTELLRIDPKSAMEYSEFDEKPLMQLLYDYRDKAPREQKQLVQSTIDSLENFRQSAGSDSNNVDQTYLDSLKPTFGEIVRKWGS